MKFNQGWTLTRKGMLIVAIPAIFQLLFLAALFAVERAHDREREAELRGKETVASAYRLLGLLVDGETAMRGYALTGDRAFAEPYDRAMALVPREVQNLRLLSVGDDAPLAGLEAAAQRVLDYHHSNAAMLNAGRRAAVVESIARQEGKRRMDQFRGAADRFLNFERTEEMSRRRAAVASRQRINVALASASVADVVVAAALAAFSER